MKKKLLAFCMLALLWVMTSHAQVEIGYLKYQLNTDNQTATVIDLVALPEDSIVRVPETVTQDNVTYTVVEIGNGAFRALIRQTDKRRIVRVAILLISNGGDTLSLPLLHFFCVFSLTRRTTVAS